MVFKQYQFDFYNVCPYELINIKNNNISHQRKEKCPLSSSKKLIKKNFPSQSLPTYRATITFQKLLEILECKFIKLSRSPKSTSHKS